MPPPTLLGHRLVDRAQVLQRHAAAALGALDALHAALALGAQVHGQPSRDGGRSLAAVYRGAVSENSTHSITALS